jgi:hypothetical protein
MYATLLFTQEDPKIDINLLKQNLISTYVPVKWRIKRILTADHTQIQQIQEDISYMSIQFAVKLQEKFKEGKTWTADKTLVGHADMSLMEQLKLLSGLMV